MKTFLVIAVIAIISLTTSAAKKASPQPPPCNSQCVQSALLRIGFNLDVSERIRNGDIDGALRALNTMNVVEVTPLLVSQDDRETADRKRRVFKKLIAERARVHDIPSEDPGIVDLNRDIDAYLRKYQ